MWVGLIPSVKGLKRKKTEVPKEEGILSLDFLWTLAAKSTFFWASNLLAYAEDVRSASLHNCVSQFLKINLPPCSSPSSAPPSTFFVPAVFLFHAAFF